MTRLIIENLSVRLPRGADRAFAIEDVSLTLAAGEILCVVGESGSGKSVTASAVMGLLAPGLSVAGGRMDLSGEDLRAKSPEECWGDLPVLVLAENDRAADPALGESGLHSASWR